MKFCFHKINTIPILSWHARIQRESSIIDVFHGTKVDTADDRFHEGAWSDVFEEGAIENACVVAGSGMKLTPLGVLLITPSHPNEHLYCARRDSILHISNSLVFLISALGEFMDPQYPNYCLDRLECKRRGAYHRPVSIPLQGGRRVNFLSMNNYIVSSDLKIKAQPKATGPKPRNFRQYYEFIKNSLEAVIENASAKGRINQLRPITTVSEGYDATAVAALSASLGCKEAINFLSDFEDGRNVGALLGLDVTTYSMNDIGGHIGLNEAEFCAMPLGSSIPFAMAEKQLAGSLLLTGDMGDHIWSIRYKILRSAQRPFANIPSDKGSLIEFRLRVGFSWLPVPTIGIMQSLTINKITRSPEMKPWRLDVEYDRPIARKIAEDAGIPRSMFGVKKRAGGHLYPWQDNAMSASGRADFLAYIEKTARTEQFSKLPKWRQILSKFHGTICQSFRRLPWWLSPLYLPITRLRIRNARHYVAGSRYLFTCQWGIEKIRHRYKYSEVVKSNCQE